MQAIVCHGFEDHSIETVPEPEPENGDVKVAIDRVQLSVTECALYRGQRIAHYEAIKRRFEDGPAQVFGHEFCGRVVELGEDVSSFEIGDRVYAPAKIPCHDCRQCDRGFELHCPNKTYLGYDTPGALAEYAVFPAEGLCTVPEGVSDAETAALQPLASSILAVDEADIGTGDVVAVIGTGVMGYQCAQLARTQGARTVIGVDVDPEKLDVLAAHGFETVNARETDPVQAVEAATAGVGADVVFEAVGGEQSHGTEGSDPLAQAFGMARSGGSVVQVGYIIDEISIAPRAVRTKSVDWINPVTGVTAPTPNTTTGELAGELVDDGRVSLEEYITHELDGLESFETAVEITLNKAEYGARGPAQIVLSE
ncbi:zinc-dependent alcohol dehydrogenase [Halopenitus malekzadehii]|nr:alcohol dehydrogenase catalytic domain-containing protein [Halopenitus malekzadehii]